jgi:hypothetical protein
VPCGEAWGKRDRERRRQRRHRWCRSPPRLIAGTEGREGCAGVCVRECVSRSDWSHAYQSICASSWCQIHPLPLARIHILFSSLAPRLRPIPPCSQESTVSFPQRLGPGHHPARHEVRVGGPHHGRDGGHSEAKSRSETIRVRGCKNEGQTLIRCSRVSNVPCRIAVASSPSSLSAAAAVAAKPGLFCPRHREKAGDTRASERAARNRESISTRPACSSG